MIAWYLIRFIDRYVVPALFGTKDKDKAPEGAGKKNFRKSTRQGDVTITDTDRPSKKVKPDDEDYVDYEEIE